VAVSTGSDFCRGTCGWDGEGQTVFLVRADPVDKELLMEDEEEEEGVRRVQMGVRGEGTKRRGEESKGCGGGGEMVQNFG